MDASDGPNIGLTPVTHLILPVGEDPTAVIVCADKLFKALLKPCSAYHRNYCKCGLILINIGNGL